MPTRILREGIISSERVNSLSERAELFYRKLMSVTDDYGRFFANPISLLGACYPLRPSVCEADVKQMLSECIAANLISVYGNGKYLVIIDFRQQTRSKSKFPEPANGELLSKCTANDKQMCSLDGGEGVVGGEGVGRSTPPLFAEAPSWEEFWEYCQSPHCGIAAEWFAKDKYLAQNATGWEKVKNWRAFATRVRGWWDNAGRPMKPTRFNGQPQQTKKKDFIP